jgi:hypothetical protein
MKIINITGHDIKIITQDGNILVPAIPGFKLIMPVTVEECGSIIDSNTKMKIPLVKYTYPFDAELIKIIAPKKKNIIYLTSRVVAQATKREDFYITGQHIKIQ